MKKLILLLAISITKIGFSQVPNYVATNGLIGWWPFNGNANDEGSNGNHGTVSGATLTTDRNGFANQAYSFDGVNDFIDAGSNISFSNFTVSAWVYMNSNPGSLNTLVSKISTNFQNFELAINGGTSFPSLAWGTGSTWESINSTQAFPATVWHHLVISYNSSNIMTLYYDGNFVLSSSTTNFVNVANFKTYFGARPNTQGISTTSYFHNGKLDDIGIWDRALTQQEITNLYNGVYNLPVELTQFSATCSESTTTINWQTASENNSAYFEVFKSRDGENWTSKTITPAAGNSTSLIDYSFTDNNDASLVYYTLKQVDKDGQYKVYGPISVDCVEKTHITIYPNPIANNFTITGLNLFNNISSISIQDINGILVKELDPKAVNFDLEKINPGVYFLTICADNKQEVVKLIKE